MTGRKYFLEPVNYGRLKIGNPNFDNIEKIFMLVVFFVYAYFQFKTPYTTLGNREVFSKETLDHGLTDYDIMMNIFICFTIVQIVLQINYHM